MSTTSTALPFFGGELSSFDPFDGNCLESSASSGVLFDPAEARCAIAVTGNVSGCESPAWPEAPTFWFHESLFVDSGNAFFGETWVNNFQNGAGTTVFKETVTSSVIGVQSTHSFYTLQGGVMTLVGSLVLPTALQRMDIKLVGGTVGGSLQVYVAETLRISVGGLDHSAWAGVANVALRGSYAGAGQGAHHSEVICDSVSHVGDRLRTIPIDTASLVNTGWSGAVGDVNEVVLNDSTFNAAAAAGLTTTYKANGFSLAGLNVVAVGVGVRGKVNSGVGPQNLQAAIRVGGANYQGPSQAQGFGYASTSKSWTTNPATSAPWQAADAAAIEAGMKSVT